MFNSLFETPISNHPPPPPQQQQQQQEVVAVAKEPDTVGVGRGGGTTFAGAFNTPGKEPRTTSLLGTDKDGAAEEAGGGALRGDNTISKLPIDWACLSPPANFKLPPDFGTGGGGTPGTGLGLGGLGGGGGASLLGVNGQSLLPSTSLLGFMDAHPKAQGAAATVMQKGVEALFQQVGGAAGAGADGGAVVDDEALAAEAAAAGRAVPLTDTSLHSIDSLLEKSNSNWLAPFATAQGAATNTNGAGGGAVTRQDDKKRSGSGAGGGQQEDVPPVSNRPFAALFGS